MDYVPPHLRHQHPEFMAWLKEGESSFAHSGYISVNHPRLEAALPPLHNGHVATGVVENGDFSGWHIWSVNPRDHTAWFKRDTYEYDFDVAVEIPLTRNQFETLKQDFAYYEGKEIPYSRASHGNTVNCASMALKLFRDIAVDTKRILPLNTLNGMGILPDKVEIPFLGTHRPDILGIIPATFSLALWQLYQQVDKATRKVRYMDGHKMEVFHQEDKTADMQYRLYRPVTS